MPLISILMAAFDAEKTILTAITSVLDQLHTNWELIIASDCHSNYIAMCTASGINHDRIRMVYTKYRGSGPSAARNSALNAANGDFLSILDSDDTWHPEKLSSLIPLAVKAGLACDNTLAIDPMGNKIASAYPISNSVFAVDALTMMESGMPHFPLFHRDLAGNGYYECLNFAEDVVFNIELIYRAGKMELLARPLTNYIQSDTSLTNAPDAWERAEIAYNQILEMLDEGLLLLPKNEISGIKASILEKRSLNQAYGRMVNNGGKYTFQEFALKQKT